jgi:hypothetical protein
VQSFAISANIPTIHWPIQFTPKSRSFYVHFGNTVTPLCSGCLYFRRSIMASCLPNFILFCFIFRLLRFHLLRHKFLSPPLNSIYEAVYTQSLGNAASPSPPLPPFPRPHNLHTYLTYKLVPLNHCLHLQSSLSFWLTYTLIFVSVAFPPQQDTSSRIACYAALHK